MRNALLFNRAALRDLPGGTCKLNERYAIGAHTAGLGEHTRGPRLRYSVGDGRAGRLMVPTRSTRWREGAAITVSSGRPPCRLHI